MRIRRQVCQNPLRLPAKRKGDVVLKEIAYVCLYGSYLNAIVTFSMEERGRLMTAMLEYAFKGIVPDFSESNERFAWPMLQEQIDRDKETYAQKCEKNRINGSKSRRKSRKDSDDPEAVASDGNRTLTPAAKDKEKDKDKDNDKDNDKDIDKDKNKDIYGSVDHPEDDRDDDLQINAYHASYVEKFKRYIPKDVTEKPVINKQAELRELNRKFELGTITKWELDRRMFLSYC